MNKPKESYSREQPRHIRASFSVRFGSQRDACGEWISQIQIRDHQTGKEVRFPESHQSDWPSWILEKLDINYPYGTEPTGEKNMIMEIVEKSVPKEKLISLYQQDMYADRQIEARHETVIFGPEASESADRYPHTRVSNGEAAGGFVRIEASAFGSLGPPSNGSGLEVETSVRAASISTEAAEATISEAEEALLLDAWHAEYSPPGTLTVMRHPAISNAILGALEVVIDGDDRQRITNGLTEEFPWRCICSLRIVAADGSAWVGTGWLVGPRTVITAGHCVYIHDRGGWVTSIEVIPGRDASAPPPFGSYTAKSFHSVVGWTELNLRSCDYGAIILPADSAVGEEVGWFGFGYYDHGVLEGTVVNLSGYPAEKSPVGSQWFHSRRVERLTPTAIEYLIDTTGGQSGSPVWWRMSDGERIAVAIHTNGAFTGNSATRITEDVYNNIVAWKEPDA